MGGKKGRRRSEESDRVRLARSIDLYLETCCRTRTVARADEFAAKWVRYDRSHLNRLATEVLGMRLHEYLRQQQLAHATRLLRSTPLSIEDIAAASAFGTPWAFYRQFKKAFDITPHQYRQSLGNLAAK
jgi:AraC-like DNA-binding protein